MTTEPQTWTALVETAHQRGARAATRAAEARERARQIERSRLAVTEPGQPAAMFDALTAQHAAERADQSRGRAAVAHLDAATAHDLAARAYELAAQTDPARADEHRRRAQRHHTQAEAARHHAAQEQ